jgi:hypothetical protein
MLSTTEKTLEILLHLEKVVSNELGDLFFCVGKVNEQFSSICNDIQVITESMANQPQYYDLSQDHCVRFLTFTLPILIEAIIKRPAKQ